MRSWCTFKLHDITCQTSTPIIAREGYTLYIHQKIRPTSLKLLQRMKNINATLALIRHDLPKSHTRKPTSKCTHYTCSLQESPIISINSKFDPASRMEDIRPATVYQKASKSCNNAATGDNHQNVPRSLYPPFLQLRA